MDIIKKLGIGGASIAILAYIGYLYAMGTVITQADVAPEWNSIYYGIIALIFLYFLIFYVIKPTYIKRYKLLNILLGVTLLLIGNYFLTNNIDLNLYVGDIITVMGVAITLLSMTSAFSLKQVKKQKEEKDMEIIEV